MENVLLKLVPSLADLKLPLPWKTDFLEHNSLFSVKDIAGRTLVTEGSGQTNLKQSLHVRKICAM